MSFIDLQLDLELVQGLAELELTNATDIQRQAIPAILDGGDLLASAPTGAGKTLAFALPALQHLLDTGDKPSDSARVLILSPTRELALQTHNTIQKVAQLTELRSTLLVGGSPYGPQQADLEKGTDVIVATPGRLVELIEREWVDLSIINFFIVDEADRMLDMGFIESVYSIVKELPKARQTLMFSATLEHSAIDKFAGQILNDTSRTITLAPPRGVPAHIKQSVFFADNDDHKAAILDALLQKGVTQAILFVSSRKQVDHWVEFMHKRDIYCVSLHGDLKQGERTER
ncbi:MAG: DEAD/DEAH box helicase, partial [Pontibacterium sp.]